MPNPHRDPVAVWYYGNMATRKMTFTFPEDLAARFLKRVPARNRSGYLAEALAQKLAERDRRLVLSCEIANRDPEVRAIEKEFDSFSHEITERWSEPRRPSKRSRTR
jgi:hypothetical protein